jgi:glutathione peroxidase
MNARCLVLALTLAALAMHAATPRLEDIPLRDLQGQPASLKTYQGKVLLLVNVASECGYTRQYKPLEAIHRKYQAQGFTVLGFPCNDFGGQEPGTPDQIRTFCTSRFDVTFPLFEKLQVKAGPAQHPLYAALTGTNATFPGPVKWNFSKFLVGRDGTILARFASADEPDGPKVTQAIEAALAKNP